MAMYLGPQSAFVNSTTTVSTAVNNNPVSGDIRWNVTNNYYEMYNGQTWVAVDAGWAKKERLTDSVGHAADTIAMYIEEDYKDNATIQDAYSEWLEATEKFRVILTMAEK